MGTETVYYRIKHGEMDRLVKDIDFFNSILQSEARDYFDMYKNAFLIALGLNPSVVGYTIESTEVESDAVCSLLLGMDGKTIHENGPDSPGVIINNLLIHTALQELEQMEKMEVKNHYARDVVAKHCFINYDNFGDFDAFFEDIVWDTLMDLKDFLDETTHLGDLLLLGVR